MAKAVLLTMATLQMLDQPIRNSDRPELAGSEAPGRDNPDKTAEGRPVVRATPRWIELLLRQPLPAKIAGANALIVVVAFAAAFAGHQGTGVELRLLVILAGALGVSLVVSVALVLIALRPLRDLHRTTQRIWEGDLDARVPSSMLADVELRRVGNALNTLLDSLMADRLRIRTLASEVISAGDRERANIARELHDSTAQTLAALVAELSVVARENSDPAIAVRVERLRRIAGDALDEVKLLSHTVHPRVLDDLGLTAALRYLAREAGDRGMSMVHLDVDSTCDGLDHDVRSVLYRVAQESINNALRHGAPRNITVRLRGSEGAARLEVEDDGRGFDVADAERRRPGMGLFTMRERAALVGGTVTVTSEAGRGTRVRATVPFGPLSRTENGKNRNQHSG